MKKNIDDYRYRVAKAEAILKEAQNQYEDFLYEETVKYDIPVKPIDFETDKLYRDEIEMKLRKAYDDEKVREQADAKYREGKEVLTN